MWFAKSAVATLAVASSLFSNVFAAKDKFTEFHGTQLANSGKPVKLDDVAFTALTKTPRDYSAAILLTALDARFSCAICQAFQPEWEMLSKQWMKGDKNAESRLVFGTLDFLDGKQTFQSLQLQTAPLLLLFRPTTGPHASTDATPLRYDFGQGLDKADPIYAFLTRSLPDRPHPPFVRPFNYTRLAVFLTAFLGFISFIVVAAPYLLPIIQNKQLWAAVSLIAILLFTSGYMFNYIRKVPYITGDQRGRLVYFVGGFQNQVGIETQLVAAMYGILSFATISLALKVPRIADPRQQLLAVFTWAGVLFAVYSFLLSVFRIKNGGYPFFLPPF